MVADDVKFTPPKPAKTRAADPDDIDRVAEYLAAHGRGDLGGICAALKMRPTAILAAVDALVSDGRASKESAASYLWTGADV